MSESLVESMAVASDYVTATAQCSECQVKKYAQCSECQSEEIRWWHQGNLILLKLVRFVAVDSQ